MSTSHIGFYKGKICGVLSVVFLCGLAAGAVGMWAYQSGGNPESHAGIGHHPTEEVSEAMAELRKELGLDDRQSSEVYSVLDECIMQEADMFVRIQELRNDGRERIARILNDQQREKFSNLFYESSQAE